LPLTLQGPDPAKTELLWATCVLWFEDRLLRCTGSALPWHFMSLSSLPDIRF